MSDQNKIKYGLSNVHWASLTITEGVPSFGTPVPFPGAVSISLPPSGDNEKFHADNIDYFVSPGGTGYDGDLEMAYIPDDFAEYAFSEITEEDGVILEEATPEMKKFALLFQFEGDKNGVRHVLYNCTASKPDIASQTKEETVTPVTTSLPISATSLYNAKKGKNLIKARVPNTSDTAAVYNGWNSNVYWPENSENNTQSQLDEE